MRDIRTVKAKSKNDQGKTVWTYVEAPLCPNCKGAAVVDGYICTTCDGKGEFRAKEKYPQINDDYQASV